MINVMFLVPESISRSEQVGQEEETSVVMSTSKDNRDTLKERVNEYNRGRIIRLTNDRDAIYEFVQKLNGNKVKLKDINGNFKTVSIDLIESYDERRIEVVSAPQESVAKQPETPSESTETVTPKQETPEASLSPEVAQSDLICVGDSVADGFNSKALSAPTSRVSLKGRGTKAILENLKSYNFKAGAKVPIWCGYNDWGNKFRGSYENIIQMAEYIKSCGAKPVICVPHNVDDSGYTGKFDNPEFKTFQTKLRSVKDFPVADFSTLKATVLHPPKSFYAQCKQILDNVRV